MVRLRDGTSFTDLKERLNEDYGFDVLMRYEDTDGDLITLETQNDLNELLESELKSIQVQISNSAECGRGSPSSSPRKLAAVIESVVSNSNTQLRPSSRVSVRPISSSSSVTRPISRSLQGYGMRHVTSRRSSNRYASHDLGSEASSVVADATRTTSGVEWAREVQEFLNTRRDAGVDKMFIRGRRTKSAAAGSKAILESVLPKESWTENIPQVPMRIL